MNEDIVLTFDDMSLKREYEKCVLFAYPDPASAMAQAMVRAGVWYNFLAGHAQIPASMANLNGSPWTIFWGHTGPEVHRGMTGTQAQADAQLMKDSQWSQEAVRACVDIKLSREQFTALESLCYNIGVDAFETSTLVRDLNGHLIEAAADQFLVWNKAGGFVSDGLISRRKAERALFILGSDFSA